MVTDFRNGRLLKKTVSRRHHGVLHLQRIARVTSVAAANQMNELFPSATTRRRRREE